MKIGLLSDTHGYLDQRIFDHFAHCDEVWHAGDIGDLRIVESLRAFKPLQVVHGNIDGYPVRYACPEDLCFERGGLKVFLTHIGGKPPSFHPRVGPLLQAKAIDILVCGHTHILRVVKHRDLLYLNPGAAGCYGIHQVRTLLRFDIMDAQVTHMEVIELGPRHP